jgi:F-type H+-transporting ATPase subunit b
MASTQTQTGTAADHGGSAVFPPFNADTFSSQLLWLAITFGLFYFLMSKIALPRISSILETRSGRIAQDLDEANRLKSESDEAIAAYEQELADAKARAHGIAQEARHVTRAELDAKRSVVEAEMASKIAEAEDRIAGIKAKALGEVGAIAEETTGALVEQLISSKVTKADVKAAVAGAKG